MLKTVAKNSVFIIAARVIDVVSVFLLTFFIARYLDLATFGQYGFINTLVTFMFSLGYAGITQITIRDVAQNRERAGSYLGANLILRTGLSVILAGIIVVIAFLIRHDTWSIFWAIAIMTGSEIISLWSLSFWDILTAYEKMRYDTISTLLFRILLLTLTGLVILLHRGLWELFLALALATLGKALFLSYVCLTKFTKPNFFARRQSAAKNAVLSKNSEGLSENNSNLRTKDLGLRTALWVYLGIKAFPIAVAFLITQANLKIGVLILKLLSTPEQIALFFAPLRLFFQLQFLPFAISLALFPVFSRSAKVPNQAKTNNDELANLFINSLRFYLTISVPVAIIFILFAQPIILLVFGTKFTAAVPCLRILMFSLPFIFLELLLANFFISIQRQAIILVSNSFCFLTNLLLNIILIPRYGAVGTSWATSISYFMLFITFFYYLRPYTGSRPILIPFLKTFVAGAGMGFILYLFYGLSWLLSLTGSILVYGILIYLVKGISADELQMMRDIIKNTTHGSVINN